MARRAITKDDYDKMVAAYREVPGNFTHCARKAGCWHGTAKRAWELGWPKNQMPPIKDVIAAEQQAARAKLQGEYETAQALAKTEVIKDMVRDGAKVEAQRAEVERQKAQEDSARSRAEEARMVRGSRTNSIGLLGVTAQLLQGGMKLAAKLRQQLEDGDFEPQEAVKIINSIAAITQKQHEAAKMAMAMERLLLGEPTEILGVKMGIESLADAEKEILAAAADLKRAQELGIIDADFEVVDD